MEHICNHGDKRETEGNSVWWQMRREGGGDREKKWIEEGCKKNTRSHAWIYMCIHILCMYVIMSLCVDINLNG